MNKVLSLVVCLVAACGGDKQKNGSCEYTFEKGSSDGNIPAGMQTCVANLVASKCTASFTGASVAGLPIKDFVFTASASCESRGFKDCDNNGMFYYRSCAKPGTAPSAAGSSVEPAQASVSMKVEATAPVATAQCVGEACAKQAMEFVKTDPAKAAVLFEKGCTDKHAISCAMVGSAYAEGLGVTKDLARAVGYDKQACELGYAKGCHNYGLAVANGEGVPADLTQGVVWLAKACELGAWKACGSVGDYRVQTGDLAGAKPILEAGCSNGDTLSCETLAKAFPGAKTKPATKSKTDRKPTSPTSADPY